MLLSYNPLKRVGEATEEDDPMEVVCPVDLFFKGLADHLVEPFFLLVYFFILIAIDKIS